MLYDRYFKPFPTINTPRLTLRAFRPSDSRDLFECCSQPEVSKYAEWEPHLSVQETKRFVSWIISRYKKKQCTVWAIEVKGSRKVIGTCSYTFIDKNYKTAEIGYCISSRYWGKGLGTEVAGALLWYGFEFVGFQRIQAKFMPENHQSKRVLEKIGMQHEGLLKKAIHCKGRSHDLMVYAITDDLYNKSNFLDRNDPYAGSHYSLSLGKET